MFFLSSSLHKKILQKREACENSEKEVGQRLGNMGTLSNMDNMDTTFLQNIH